MLTNRLAGLPVAPHEEGNDNQRHQQESPQSEQGPGCQFSDLAPF